jgi:7-cyano-7-deazaguanine synthase
MTGALVKPAVLLLSGGLDSATTLAIAAKGGWACHCLSIDYGQRHRAELRAAAAVARDLGAVEHRVVSVDLRAIGGSALTDAIEVPRSSDARPGTIPATYVPARNLVLLSLAVGHAEVVGARDIFIGVNAVDYSGYPDCRPEFVRAFEQAARLGTKAGVEGASLTIHTPLIDLSKAQIIRRGHQLGVNYALTSSCYDPGASGAACGACESCALRRRGFEEAGMPDPITYVRSTDAAGAGA